jgi:hypothetical protein
MILIILLINNLIKKLHIQSYENEKVINILKKKPLSGILTLTTREYQIQLAEKIRIELEDKQKNRRKSHYSD